jgi:hypothetical protein
LIKDIFKITLLIENNGKNYSKPNWIEQIFNIAIVCSSIRANQGYLLLAIAKYNRVQFELPCPDLMNEI